MEDMKRVTISAPVIPVRGNDIDTDRIIPARFLRCVTFEGLGEHAFEDDRKQLNGTHPFDNAKFAKAQILIGNRNFGCGSSREHAPQAIARWGQGIQAVVAESFAEIFFGNCVTLGIPCATASEADLNEMQTLAENAPDTAFTLDVDKLTVSASGKSWKVFIPAGPRAAFLEGKWDGTVELLDAKDAIAKVAAKLPYFSWK